VSFTDADLIARVLSHEDQFAFGELVRRYQSPVRAFLARMIHDSATADDLAQQTQRSALFHLAFRHRFQRTPQRPPPEKGVARGGHRHGGDRGTRDGDEHILAHGFE
jgi:hypothetical protein